MIERERARWPFCNDVAERRVDQCWCGIDFQCTQNGAEQQRFVLTITEPTSRDQLKRIRPVGVDSLEHSDIANLVLHVTQGRERLCLVSIEFANRSHFLFQCVRQFVGYRVLPACPLGDGLPASEVGHLDPGVGGEPIWSGILERDRRQIAPLPKVFHVIVPRLSDHGVVPVERHDGSLSRSIKGKQQTSASLLDGGAPGHRDRACVRAVKHWVPADD